MSEEDVIVYMSSPTVEENEESHSSTPITPVRLFVSPSTQPLNNDFEVPPVPSSEALSNSRILSIEEDDLTCTETFLDPPDPKPKNEPIEDTMDRYVMSVKGGAMMIGHLWDEIYLKLSRMKHERQALKRTMDYLEEQLEDAREELKTHQAVNKMMARTVHRLKKQALDKEEVSGYDEGCAICSRTINELMNANLARIAVACCANLLCLDCIVQTTHIQQSNHPLCPFCRDPLC